MTVRPEPGGEGEGDESSKRETFELVEFGSGIKAYVGLMQSVGFASLRLLWTWQSPGTGGYLLNQNGTTV